MYRAYLKRYTTCARLLYCLALVLTLASAGAVYYLTKNVAAAGWVLGSGCLFFGLLYGMQRTDDHFISSVIEDVSAMLDALMELEKKEVFPIEEDSLVSKLQNQLLEIVRILQKREERANEEQAHVKSLVSDLSHQLKTPLATLKMYMEFLEQEQLSDAERLQYVKVVQQALSRLLFLSEGMIKISRLESGLVTIEKQEASINDTILMAIKNAYGKTRESGAQIQYEEKYKGNVNHDPKWTAEAIFNLIENAIKYGDANNIVTVSVQQLGASIEIAVTDCNALIPREDYPSIFKRFFRGKNGKEVEGAGIGLYLTRDIIEKQGGFVSVKAVKSAGKAGNRFSITLHR